jgi:hypothetical protein
MTAQGTQRAGGRGHGGSIWHVKCQNAACLNLLQLGQLKTCPTLAQVLRSPHEAGLAMNDVIQL